MAKTWADLQGWFNFHQLYDEQIGRATDGAIFVEVGCWQGRSLAYLGNQVKESGKRIQVWGVERGFGSPELDACWLPPGASVGPALVQNLHDCGLSDQVGIIVADSLKAARLFGYYSLDFVFIDASHEYNQVVADAQAWWERVKTGGTLAGHDYDIHYPGVVQAVHDVFGFQVQRAYPDLNCWCVTKR